MATKQSKHTVEQLDQVLGMATGLDTSATDAQKENLKDALGVTDLEQKMDGTTASQELNIISGKYIKTSGGLGGLSSYGYSTPILVPKGCMVIAHCNGSANGSVSIASCDSVDDVTFVPLVIADETGVLKKYTYKVQKDTYISISGKNDGTLAMEIYTNGAVANIEDLQEDVSGQSVMVDSGYLIQSVWKALFIGDSLTSGAKPTDTWGDMDLPSGSIDQNIPRLFGRMVNGEASNGGISGYSPCDWYRDWVSTTGYFNMMHQSEKSHICQVPKYNFADYDTFFIWLGTNYGPLSPDSVATDTLNSTDWVSGQSYSVGDIAFRDGVTYKCTTANSDETFTKDNWATAYDDFAETDAGYYCRIIEAIKSANASCLIVMAKVFATSNSNLSSLNSALETIADKYGCLLADYSQLGAALRPDLHMKVANNPHFGKAGNLYVANQYVKLLTEYFAEDVLRCEYGFTQRTN